MSDSVGTWWRPLSFGLAAAVLWVACASAQTPLSERITQCTTCHGENGNSRIENIPSLAGQPEFFVLNQLFLMREGVRQVAVMMPFVKDLTDDDLNALAGHFSKLSPKRSGEPIDPALVKRGEELAALRRCGSCHLSTLTGQQQMPRLAKQRIDFLNTTMKAFRDSPRRGADTLMSAAVVGLSEDDILALAHYAASR
ncbi:MAG: c-type cytochrome [Xanthobacteraceae bacterium]